VGKKSFLRAMRILMVDDNPGDIRLVKEALQGSNIQYNLYSVNNGEEALSSLRHKQEAEYFTKPDLILLDLNLPIKSGREVLQEIKQDKRICDIPVIIFSSSRSKDDIDQMYELGALSFISKPENLDNFTDLVQELENFWMNVSASSSE
jgi:chemotaxis family two-component system response regulator Rcp1